MTRSNGVVFWTVSLLCLLWSASCFANYDPDKAREQYQKCKSFVEAGKPCQALVACEEGLRAMDVGNLRKLTDQARGICVKREHKVHVERRKKRRCSHGKERIGEQCCWPGQNIEKKGVRGGICEGVPTQCPESYTLDAEAQVCSQTQCAEGKTHADDVHCCWPGQVWFDKQGPGRCIGVPECVAGLRAAGEECIVVIPDQDGDGIADSDDECPTIKEDFDGFEDGDGCPEFDNDNDGICDAIFAAGLDPKAAMSFEDFECRGSDGCPMEPEDNDGYEDNDGCPDLDNDRDGVLDVDDKCPLVLGFVEYDGCVPPPSYTLKVTGWSSVGVGVGLLALGSAFQLSTLDDREKLNNPNVSLDQNDVVLSLTEVESEALRTSIDDAESGAMISFGVGGALLVTGAALLVLDALTEKELPTPIISMDPKNERAFFGVQGHF